MGLILLNGKLLITADGKLATSLDCCCDGGDCCTELCAQDYLEAVVTLQTKDGEITGTLRLDPVQGVDCEFTNEENGDQFLGDYQAIVEFHCDTINPEQTLRSVTLGYPPNTCLGSPRTDIPPSIPNVGDCCPYDETYDVSVAADCDEIYSGTVRIKTPANAVC